MRTIILSLALLFLFACGSDHSKKKVSFNENIRPILASKCMSCHGGVKKLGGFSILTREEALGIMESGEVAIIPGLADSSLLIHLLTDPDPEIRMPQEGEPLSSAEIQLIKNWIDNGAEWEEHWSFIPPQKPEVPEMEGPNVRNEIDHFISERLKEKGLSLQVEQEKTKLIRRLSFDLRGLPPTLEDVESFLNNKSPEAYEQVVDEYLASPAYGEHWASMWLDLARYADSKGYEADRHREIWKFRDWVIGAFNNDLPFDEFTLQQLAGDMLPDADTNKLIATAFHRNTMNNDEGGTDDEEFRVASVIDRVNTTWDVWMGMSFSCVQCHSHPYDPFDHEDYYEFMAFLNNTRDADKPDESPTIPVYTVEQERTRAVLQQQIKQTGTSANSPDQWASLKDSLEKIKPTTLPVMEELTAEERRTTYLYDRGNWLAPGKEVSPNIPGSLTSSKPVTDRLAMARWMIGAQNPFTSRVTANRFWGALFGKGIVETQEDFGSQGMAPSHPELLDWLAVYFREEAQWSIKSLLKKIVMSGAYRQSELVDANLLQVDPYNKLISRSPRLRLTAEQVRDQALAISGLLSSKMYGPSVMPVQPEGIWQAVYNGSSWQTSKGDDQYRRALYTYIRRTSPYPSMITFDSPSREFCVNRRIATNTPLQALVTLNDPVYFEAAEALAEKMKLAGEEPTDQISAGYEMALFKQPTAEILHALSGLYHEASGEAIPENQLISEKADLRENIPPLVLVANAIMNLDAFITK